MRRLRLVLSASVLSALASGCDLGTLDDLAQDQAAEGAEELSLQARALWNVYDKPDESVKRAIPDLAGIVDRAGSLPVKVRIADLTPDDLEPIGFGAKDAAGPQGMLVVTEIDCTLDALEKLVVAKNQTTIYPGLYETYTRGYTSSVQDFLGGRAQRVTWRTDYTAGVLSRKYASNLTGGARRALGAAPDGKNVLLARTYLNEPATFTEGGDAAFEQDYQVEAYWERTPGKVLHYYGLWRQFRVAEITSESDIYVNLVLDNLVDFDVRTSKVCREKAPVPAFE